MDTISLTPTKVYNKYSWSNTLYETEYFEFMTNNSDRYLIQMPATSAITADKVKQITISFIDDASENVDSGKRTLYIGFSNSKSFPTSYKSGIITYNKNNGARQYFTISATPTVSINNTWYMEIYWDDEYNTVFTSASSLQITLTYSDDNTIKYYTGSAWVDCIPYYHNGSGWVQCVPYYHNSSGWIECSSS